ncbi:PP2C family serine/threonine-protein phosphatase [uncultured Kordia sp.]|uniref:PP2C family serine/threonine-protein phosphatase n=1 Tax=uncultured Kordia sp. TaxID=507699 RepID=UPI002615CA95|nr:PP2C family serine/threonine-protein phosphatase [uncultured Kordia sp.]
MKNEYKNYIQRICFSSTKKQPEKISLMVNDFMKDEKVHEIYTSIVELETEIMKKWKIQTLVTAFKNNGISTDNGTEKVPYIYTFPHNFLEKNNLIKMNCVDLDKFNLTYNQDTMTIEGTPEVKLDDFFTIEFLVDGEEASEIKHQKQVKLLINPDPKSLWKDIPSDTNALFWKEDDKSEATKIGEKSIVVSSKRGRSHKNVGSFRDDDYAFKYFEDSEWTIVAVSDGAGSAKFSRKGSEIACSETIKCFENVAIKELELFEEEFNQFIDLKEGKQLEQAKETAIKAIYKVAVHAHTEIEKIASETALESPKAFDKTKILNKADYFHATLIFIAFKKINNKYVFLSFGVGDCPIGIINKDRTEAKLLNWLDIGKYGGGTRFITNREIFSSKERPIVSRFNVYITEDFSFLFLMTDGIYDAKFIVEANLEKTEKWLEFIADLEGRNEDNVTLDFSRDLNQLEENLNNWMDFWSKGNHDDRTLAIIF